MTETESHKALRVARVMIAPAIVLSVVAYCDWWVLDERDWFLFDDYDWFARLGVSSFAEVGTWLPTQAYNDRPVGALAIKVLYSLFALDGRPYHRALLLLHLFNTLLVYVLAFRVAPLLSDQPQPTRIAFATALFFGAWPKSIMAAYWLAAIFDLLGVTLVLLVILLYLRVRSVLRPSPLWSVLTCLVFFAALRTKEMTVVVPVILCLAEAFALVQQGGWRRLAQLRRAPAVSFVLLCMAIAYALLIFTMIGRMKILTDASGPYFVSLQPLSLLTNAMRYVVMYFDLSSLRFDFPGLGRAQLMSLAIVCAALVASVVAWLRHKTLVPIVIVAAVLVSLAPVLQLKNMQHRLYLYMPSLFFSLGVSVALTRVPLPFMHRRVSAYVLPIVIVLIAAHARPVLAFSEWWLELSKRDKVGLASLAALKPPPQGALLLVPKASEPYNLFNPNGKANAARIVYGDPTLTLEYRLPSATERGPYVWWDLDTDSGRVTELGRTGDGAPRRVEEHSLQTVEVIPNTTARNVRFNVQPNGVSAISVRSKNAYRGVSLYWDDVPLESAYNHPGLVTAYVPDALLQEAGAHLITLRASTGVSSNAVRFNVTSD